MRNYGPALSTPGVFSPDEQPEKTISAQDLMEQLILHDSPFCKHLTELISVLRDEGRGPAERQSALNTFGVLARKRIQLAEESENE